jgi:hypothetical protein
MSPLFKTSGEIKVHTRHAQLTRRARRAPRAPIAMAPRVVVSFDVGTRNFSFCIARSAPFEILAWEVIDTYTEGGASSKSNIDEKKVALLRCLHARRELFARALGAGDAVVIEQQPYGRGFGSPTMNILAHVIGAFFYMAAPVPCEPVFSVRQVAARAKLAVDPEAWGGARCDGGAGADCAETGEPRAGKRRRKAEYQQYKKNKGWSIEACRSILCARDELAPWRAVFDTSKKKDDLADSFMQALSQLEPTTPTPHRSRTEGEAIAEEARPVAEVDPGGSE